MPALANIVREFSENSGVAAGDGDASANSEWAIMRLCMVQRPVHQSSLMSIARCTIIMALNLRTAAVKGITTGSLCSSTTSLLEFGYVHTEEQ